MAREKESYRDNLERLDRVFPEKEILSPTEVAKWLGIDKRSAVSMFSFTARKVNKNYHYFISKAVLAREIS